MARPRTVVIGAGVVGNATAYFLHELGHDVTVVDRQPGAAMETSLGNGGVVHASEVEPWSQPGMPLKIMAWMGKEDSPLLLRYRTIPHIIRWGMEFVANCTPEKFRRNSLCNLKLALLSLRSLHEIRAATGVEYDRGARGVLKIYRDEQSLDHADANTDFLAQHGLVYRRVSHTECAKLEPALQPTAHLLAGGLYFERDEVGDPNKFAQEVAKWLVTRGVEYRFGVVVRRLARDGVHIKAVETAAERLTADHFVVAAGSYTPLLLRPLGIRVPICPVKGISLTVPVGPWREAPKMPVIDDSRLFGLVPIGERLRVSGSAELAGYDATASARRGEAIARNVLKTFPDFAKCYERATATWWAGLRPVTPTGVGFMGRTPIRNLFINAGHGHLGWTMSSGAGRVVAAIVAGEKPDLDLVGFPQLPGAAMDASN
jgi:D-amino-acid dehydrogenase